MEWFVDQHAVLQALVAGTFTWGMTAAGAVIVLVYRKIHGGGLGVALGLAAGIMIAASFWSLLSPSIELADAQGTTPWLPALVGFTLGGLAIRGMDMVLPHEPPGRGPSDDAARARHRTTLLITAVTVHNVPEGLAVGVAFAAAADVVSSTGLGQGTVGGAVALAVGIGIQNVPEGAAVAIPLRAQGFSRWRAFWYGQLSGAVEPISAVIGAGVVLIVRPILPYALSFAAGAMIYVVLQELVPHARSEAASRHQATLAAMFGFGLMMTLDVALS